MNSPAGLKLCPVLLSALLAFFLPACTKEDREQAQTRKDDQAQTSANKGPDTVTISRSAQEASGIAVTLLKAASHRQEIPAYGTVVDLQGLFSLRDHYAEAQARVDRTGARLDASQKAFERLKSLYAEGQDISAKALQAAEASFRSDEADNRAAAQALETAKAALLQQWGGTIASWISEASPGLERLYRQEDILIRLTIPPDQAPRNPPPSAMIAGAENKFETARFVSISPSIDPALQGASFFYIAPAKRAGLFPGMNVLAYLETGPKARGVIIPASAVVWWQGRAWVYVQKGKERFFRREAATDTPVPEGWFVAKGFSAGELIVTSGAELILSREFLPAAPAEEDED